ncbi:MAG: fatty acid desaturase [Ignavibacteriae bacterium HGW-Ignavibacteriae-2]|jgi:acyl-[acyl-carrier-protein] desaturase|nr:MAG: fatty acid desaturase [Ignavibacteriae bacterium HGW-Ignavibacteriae-2]
MNTSQGSETNKKFETESKVEVLQTLEHKVKELMESHIAKRKLWYSSDFLPADEKNDENQEKAIIKLRERTRGIGDEARVAIGLNLLTEEGLPHFHRIIAKHLGDDSFWAKWNNMWTAEEDRHGGVLRDYARDSRLFNFSRLEQMQYVYQEKGFNPDWDKDPYRVFVYTTLQERATQFSHKNTGSFIGDSEPLINGILSSIAADEAKHFTFYRNVFKEILEIDPNRALESALAIMPAIDMPGISMPNFREMADVIRRVNIYGPRDYKIIVEEALKFWNIALLDKLNDVGRAAQEKLMNIPARLEKVAEYIEQRTTKKTFSFDLIYNRILVME